jgi:dipeptidyl aminopeptidase/acylaminoacyl peptidase
MKNQNNYLIVSITVLLIIISIIIISAMVWLNLQPKSGNNDTYINPTPTVIEQSSLVKNSQLQGRLAFIRDDNLWIENDGVKKQLTTDAIPTTVPYQTGFPKLWYSNPQISPDGSKIAYLKNVDSSSRILLVSDINGESLKQFAEDVEWTMPTVQWSSDSQQIYYPASNGSQSIGVKSVNILTGQSQKYGEFAMSSGCGGGSDDPADHISAGENIISVGGEVQIFEISPKNDFIVHTVSCTGSGLGLFDLVTKQDRSLIDNAKRATFSPDGNVIAAVYGNSIVTLDLSGQIQHTYETSGKPLVILWSSDGQSIYYSTSKLSKSLEFDKEVALELFGSSSLAFRANTSTLWELSLNSGSSEKVIDLDVHNMKPIFVLSQSLLVITIDNSTALYEYINGQRTKDGMVQYYPQVKLLEVNLSSLSSVTVSNEVQESSFFFEY